jgi:murein L,D-transpeptidase YcbB/YkuD
MSMHVIRLSIAAVLGLGFSAHTYRSAAAQSVAPAAAGDVAATVDRVLTSANHPGLTWGSISDVTDVLTALYDTEPDRLLWFDRTSPASTLEATLAAIAKVGAHGLDPADYDAEPLAEQWTDIKGGHSSGPERAHFDLAISVAVARLIKAVHFGRVDPAMIQWGYTKSARQLDVGAQFREARQGKGLAATLDAIEPSFAHYSRAKKVLAIYKAAARGGEPAAVPDLPKGRTKVEPGQSWVGVPQLAARLRAFGDLPSTTTLAGSAYAGPLVDAVKSFQGRHVLDPDGIVGAGTIKAVNVSLAARVRQIELAMERMRWLPKLSERPNIFVNVPLFRMWATDPVTGEEPLRMNIVVGKALNHRTPMFVEQMEYVVFRPYWNPPYSITVKEIIPHIRRDPAYFARESLEIVASGGNDAEALPPTEENLAAVAAGKLFLRQKPGPSNSLGLAKFIFPNDDNIYMHGTPAMQLFSRARRDFSHGCIRLEEPARFAEWVLRDDPSWTRQRIAAAMQGERPVQVNLKEPITVVIFYDTVHVNSEGIVYFAEDIYQHDKALDVLLEQGYPYPVKS